MYNKAYAIALLPNLELGNKVINLSNDLQTKEVHFTLNGVDYLPHLSLYSAKIKHQDLQKVTNILMNIISETKKFDLIANGYSQVMGYLAIDYVNTHELASLAKDVVEAVNPYRQGLSNIDQERMKSATDLTLQNFVRYGYKYVGDLFRPHITITRFNTIDAIDVNELPSHQEFNGTFDSLGIFEMGENGTCKHEVASYGLQ